MTLETRLIALILDRKIFPFLNVAEPVVVVRKTITVDTEIVRNQELPGKQNQSDQCDCKPQWVQDMPLHFHLSLCRSALERLILISTTYVLRLFGLPELRRRHPHYLVNRSVLMT
jgi:hypothetical protein